VQLELELQRGGVLGEAAQVVLRRERFAPLLAEQILGEDQVDGQLGVVPHGREGVEIGLCRYPLAQPKPLCLVNQQDLEHLGGVMDAGLRQEVVGAGRLAHAPGAPQAIGRIVAVVGGLRGRRRP
jgi:hypothetical protein